MNYVGGFFLLIIGVIVGLDLPDLDLRLNFLVHRSIITHSFFFPLILFWLIRKKEQIVIYLLSIGFSLAYVIHLCFDLFPRAWTGFALISIPLYGRISPVLSWLWTAGSIILCLYLVLLLIRSLWDVFIVLSSTIATFSFYAVTERVFWSALLALSLATFIALMLPSDSSVIFRKLIRKSVSKL